MLSPNPLTSDFQYPDMAPTCAKYPLTNITEVANNGMQPAKKQKHFFGIKLGKCALSDITEVVNNSI